MIMIDSYDEHNVYQWKEVRMNLPGSPDYDPSLAWVANAREDVRVAADLLIYMDDFHMMGPDADECWMASRKAASICNYLGIQDAPRKRREVSRAPGPWAGFVVYTDDSAAGVRKEVVQGQTDTSDAARIGIGLRMGRSQRVGNNSRFYGRCGSHI
jgi:hypothetical protein